MSVNINEIAPQKIKTKQIKNKKLPWHDKPTHIKVKEHDKIYKKFKKSSKSRGYRSDKIKKKQEMR